MDVSPLLKYFNAQWRLAADARSASKQRVFEYFSNYFLQNCHDHENIIEQIIESDKWNSM